MFNTINKMTLTSIYPIEFLNDVNLLRFNRLFYYFMDIIKKLHDFKNFNKKLIQELLELWLRDYLTTFFHRTRK